MNTSRVVVHLVKVWRDEVAPREGVTRNISLLHRVVVKGDGDHGRPPVDFVDDRLSVGQVLHVAECWEPCSPDNPVQFFLQAILLGWEVYHEEKEPPEVRRCCLGASLK